MDNFLVIDGSSLVNRAFYAVPPLTNKKGIMTNAIYGFNKMLDRLLTEFKPTKIAVLFDSKGPTFRHKMYDGYKATRKGFPDELSLQIDLLKNLLDARGIKNFDKSGVEADDLAGSLSRKFENKYKMILVTGDRDYFQLITENTKVLYTVKGISETLLYGIKEIEDKYGITPQQLIDLKALMGDSSDNIPGVPGVGEKTGLKLILEYQTLDGVYEHLEDIKGKSIKKKLEENKERAYMSYELGKIKTDVELPDENEFVLSEVDFETLNDIYSALEFKDQVNGSSKLDISLPTYKFITESELLQKIFNQKILAFKLFFRDDYHKEEPLFMAVYDGNEVYIIKGPSDKKVIVDFLVKNECIGYNSKEDMYFLFEYLKEYPFKCDVALLYYLIDPTTDIANLGDIYSKTHKQYHNFDTYIKENKKAEIKDLISDEAGEFVASSMYMIYSLYFEYLDKIKMYDMESLLYDVELPLSFVLAGMEKAGFLVDRNKLIELGEYFDDNLNEMEDKIYELAGEKFNINSPKQLAEILFEKIGLEPIRKTKTGYSTDQETLIKLSMEHELPKMIIDYREDKKLKSTYIDGILNILDDDNRLRSKYDQTKTATGRISSTEPNMQNIPIRSEKGRLLRKVFIADKGCILYDIDYSQIELRILAAISSEKKMLEGFEGDMDIHRKTASEVFNTPYEDVTKTQRSHAKAVNFGIVYGISDYGLSNQLNITREEAKEYIDNYFREFPSIEKYMSEIVEGAKEQGYVTTLFNRRRAIPEIMSKNFNIRSFGERIALNTPIQGTAADIIKIAMVKVDKFLRENKLNSRLILTIHDELILEVIEEEKNIIEDNVQKIMTDFDGLGVKLKADGEFGKTWFDVK